MQDFWKQITENLTQNDFSSNDFINSLCKKSRGKMVLQYQLVQQFRLLINDSGLFLFFCYLLIVLAFVIRLISSSCPSFQYLKILRSKGFDDSKPSQYKVIPSCRFVSHFSLVEEKSQLKKCGNNEDRFHRQGTKTQ